MDIEKEIETLKERNRRVEAEKAWEQSKTRILIIALFTYVITAVVFYIIGISNY